MKTLIAAALLLALASPACCFPAPPYGTAAREITAIANKGEFTISMGKAYKKKAYPDHGVVKWNFRDGNSIVQLDDKLCKETN